jgi:hypothetical protein
LALPLAWQPDLAQLVVINGLTLAENFVVIVLQSTVPVSAGLSLFLLHAIASVPIQAAKPKIFFIEDVLIETNFLILNYDP